VAAGLATTLAVTSGGSATPRLSTTNAALTAPNTAAVPRCLSQNLQVWIGIGEGQRAAGSTFYPLEFTNLRGYPCELRGFPGVSVTKLGVMQGNPAGRESSPARVVYLGPGATAHATLQVTNVDNYPKAVCKPVLADTIRVFAPGAYNPNYVPYGLKACSTHGPRAPVYLRVRAVAAGTGIPGQP